MTWPRVEGMTYRPFGAWPRAVTAQRRRSMFDTSDAKIRGELVTELRMHHASNVVLSLDIGERDLRNDGHLRADTRPEGPGVILSMTTPDGPLSFPCDTFESTADNLLAIVRTMNALRRTGTYGVTRNEEQYASWRAIEAGGSGGSREAALAVIREFVWTEDGTMRLPGDVTRAIRLAKRFSHPDQGGSAEDFRRVVEAERILTT